MHYLAFFLRDRYLTPSMQTIFPFTLPCYQNASSRIISFTMRQSAPNTHILLDITFHSSNTFTDCGNWYDKSHWVAAPTSDTSFTSLQNNFLYHFPYITQYFVSFLLNSMLDTSLNSQSLYVLWVVQINIHENVFTLSLMLSVWQNNDMLDH